MGRYLSRAPQTTLVLLSSAEVVDPPPAQEQPPVRWAPPGFKAHATLPCRMAGCSSLPWQRQRPAALTKAAELYDPATGVWGATGSTVCRALRHTATLLPLAAKVLVAHGGVIPQTLLWLPKIMNDPPLPLPPDLGHERRC